MRREAEHTKAESSWPEFETREDEVHKATMLRNMLLGCAATMVVYLVSIMQIAPIDLDETLVKEQLDTRAWLRWMVMEMITLGCALGIPLSIAGATICESLIARQKGTEKEVLSFVKELSVGMWVLCGGILTLLTGGVCYVVTPMAAWIFAVTISLMFAIAGILAFAGWIHAKLKKDGSIATAPTPNTVELEDLQGLS